MRRVPGACAPAPGGHSIYAVAREGGGEEQAGGAHVVLLVELLRLHERSLGGLRGPLCAQTGRRRVTFPGLRLPWRSTGLRAEAARL